MRHGNVLVDETDEMKLELGQLVPTARILDSVGSWD